MDLEKISRGFEGYGFEVEFLRYPEIDLRERNFGGQFVLYTSSEDDDLLYKSYIEDVIYALELQGAFLIPSYALLRAHHNKVFMELIRDIQSNPRIKNIRSRHFGTKEDFLRSGTNIEYPFVVKGAAGAVGSSVYKIDSKSDARKKVAKVSRSMSLTTEIRDIARFIRHKGYVRDSKYRRKFVVQDFQTHLNRDWKIIVFGQKVFVLERMAKPNDFRASGSGILGYSDDLPPGLLDYAYEVCTGFEVPFLAMDIGFDGNEFCLIEFQALYFGTHTVDTAPFFFVKIDDRWDKIEKPVEVETEFVGSVMSYIKERFDFG
jgi:glutathione synthase/RimK-type ligase-like ATP-grasp enzyme